MKSNSETVALEVSLREFGGAERREMMMDDEINLDLWKMKASFIT